MCVNLSLVGVHRDGALQEQLRVPATQVFPVGDLEPALAAFIEPVSIAVRAVVRARIEAGEKAVIFGAGPIGQSIAAAADDRGASVLLVDRVASRLALGRALGAETLLLDQGADSVAAAREWAGGDGPEVVFEATGVPAVARTAVELVAQAGRVVIVGLSAHRCSDPRGRPAFKEIDVLGVSCCQGDEFADAVSLVARRQDALRGLVTHEFPLVRDARRNRVRDRSSCRGDEGGHQAGGVIALRTLDASRAEAVEALCELIVPGRAGSGRSSTSTR